MLVFVTWESSYNTMHNRYVISLKHSQHFNLKPQKTLFLQFQIIAINAELKLHKNFLLW